jgi:hypothetical protein
MGDSEVGEASKIRQVAPKATQLLANRLEVDARKDWRSICTGRGWTSA